MHTGRLTGNALGAETVREGDPTARHGVEDFEEVEVAMISVAGKPVYNLSPTWPRHSPRSNGS